MSSATKKSRTEDGDSGKGASGGASADDWPMYGGANHDNVSLEKGLLKSWPTGGPKLAWSATKLGS